MDILLNLEAVTSQHNLRGLRHLFDIVEANVRGLRASGVPSDSYGGLLSSILMSRLPPELWLVIRREMSDEEWDFESIMKIIKREVDARERPVGNLSVPTRRVSGRTPPTAVSLMANTSMQVNCVYCNRHHPSILCKAVTTPEMKKQALCKSGRCFVYLKRHHISRNCLSPTNCTNCHGQHHTSICMSFATRTEGGSCDDLPSPTEQTTQATPTSLMCVNSQTPILLQPAKAVLSNPSQLPPLPTLEVRAILDSGSQRSYVTTQICEMLSLKKI